MTEHTTPTPRTKKTKRNLILALGIAVVAVLAGAGIAFSLANQTEPEAFATPEPTSTSSPNPSISAEPTQSPAATPEPEPTSAPTEPTKPIPDDCRRIYTPAFLDLWAGQPLNDPSLVGVGISRYESVENLRESLPGIECKWGEATEGGMSNAVNQVTPETKSALVAAATGEGFSCVENGTGATVCGISVGPTEGDEWVVAEELYFRDGLVVTTWRASTAGSIADSSQPVYDTLWP